MQVEIHFQIVRWVSNLWSYSKIWKNRKKGCSAFSAQFTSMPIGSCKRKYRWSVILSVQVETKLEKQHNNWLQERWKFIFFLFFFSGQSSTAWNICSRKHLMPRRFSTCALWKAARIVIGLVIAWVIYASLRTHRLAISNPDRSIECFWHLRWSWNTS